LLPRRRALGGGPHGQLLDRLADDDRLRQRRERNAGDERAGLRLDLNQVLGRQPQDRGELAEIPLVHFDHLVAFGLRDLHRLANYRVLCHIFYLLEDPHAPDVQVLPVDFQVECGPERRGVPGIVHHHVRNTETCCHKTKRTYSRTCIDKERYRRFSHVHHYRAELRVSSPGKLNVDKGLLFVHHQGAGGERKDIRTYIAAGKEFIDPWDRVQVGFSKTRDKCTGLYHTPHFRYFVNQAQCSLFCHNGREQDQGVRGKERRTVHRKPRVNERGPGRDQRVCPLEETVLHHDAVDMNKYFIDEPLPAGTGFGSEGDHIAGAETVTLDYEMMPRATYCQPQIASFGLTEAQARERGYSVKIGRFPFQANGKALGLGDYAGWVKLVVDEKYNEILGASMIGPEVTELLPELTLAHMLELTPEEIARNVHAHPTISEAVMEAAHGAIGDAIHI